MSFYALTPPCLLSRIEVPELKKLFCVRAKSQKGLKFHKKICREAEYTILFATWHQCDCAAAGSKPAYTQTDDCLYVKYSQASEIRFSILWSPLILFFLLKPYTKFISWTNRLRNVHSIPNNVPPVLFTMALLLLLLASLLLLSSLYHTDDLLVSWDKAIHPAQFVSLSHV